MHWLYTCEPAHNVWLTINRTLFGMRLPNISRDAHMHGYGVDSTFPDWAVNFITIAICEVQHAPYRYQMAITRGNAQRDPAVLWQLLIKSWTLDLSVALRHQRQHGKTVYGAPATAAIRQTGFRPLQQHRQRPAQRSRHGFQTEPHKPHRLPTSWVGAASVTAAGPVFRWVLLVTPYNTSRLVRHRSGGCCSGSVRRTCTAKRPISTEQQRT